MKHLLLTLLIAGAGCGGGGDADDDGDDQPAKVDRDDDGYSVEEGDCDDERSDLHPGAPDPCDGFDQNCDGVRDEAFDVDEDGWTTCSGDCRDNDVTVNPGAGESLDGRDNDCDNLIDNHTNQYDDDGDGYSEDQGDCNDAPLGGELINPGAFEVQLGPEGDPEGIDNDCDEAIDEDPPPCPTDLSPQDARAFAVAVDLCEGASARFTDSFGIDPRSRGLFSDYGDTYVANRGPDFVVLSTGIAGDSGDPGFVALDDGTEFITEVAHPDAMGAIGCSEADSSWVNDYSELILQIDVPTNAKSFSFDFNFMSVEFPEFVCSEYDDTFLAMLESQAFNGNVSFDSLGNRVSINVGFFTKCDDSLDSSCDGDDELRGTGYEGLQGGGTGWLTTTSPVTPGEKIKLTFAIFDEGDHVLDSAVLLDNFRWELEPVDGPVTVPRLDRGQPAAARRPASRQTGR